MAREWTLSHGDNYPQNRRWGPNRLAQTARSPAPYIRTLSMYLDLLTDRIHATSVYFLLSGLGTSNDRGWNRVGQRDPSRRALLLRAHLPPLLPPSSTSPPSSCPPLPSLGLGPRSVAFSSVSGKCSLLFPRSWACCLGGGRYRMSAVGVGTSSTTPPDQPGADLLRLLSIFSPSLGPVGLRARSDRGASNSGKTTLAKHIHRLLPNSTIIHLDDFAPVRPPRPSALSCPPRAHPCTSPSTYQPSIRSHKIRSPSPLSTPTSKTGTPPPPRLPGRSSARHSLTSSPQASCQKSTAHMTRSTSRLV